MKFALIIIMFTFTLINNSDCAKSDWFPEKVFYTVKNRTYEAAKYLKEKGKYLNDNVLMKFRTIFGKNEPEIVKLSPQDRQATANKKFYHYITQAVSMENQIFDAIAPETDIKCSSDDPKVKLTTPQLIALSGYPAESHTITTDDGYILTIHRIPYSKNSDKNSPKKTVLLHHGLLGSSADWIIPGPDKSLAYFLSDNGYDVWLANARGNTYSRAHVTRKDDTYAFWNFTWHDISQHDLPAVIDYITEFKGNLKINYIGHSMGTTILFALLSTKTQYNDVLKAGFALAPVAYMSEIRSPIKILAKFVNNIEYLMKLLGANEFLPQNAVLRWLSKHACEINHYEEAICENSLFVLCGHDEKQFNKTLLPIILGHVPAGASTKTLIHYAQEVHGGGKFQQYDYGQSGNMRQYGTPEPPEYSLTNISLRIAFISGQNDWLASENDVTRLYKQLANPIEHFVVPMKEFNHIDFLYAIDGPKLYYDKLLQLMNDEEQSEQFVSVTNLV